MYIFQVYKLNGIALEHARSKYCNKSKASLRSADVKPYLKPAFISDIVWSIVNYTKSSVDKALLNLTHFCENSDALDQYLRSSCPFFDKVRCPKTYRSTKSGNFVHYTQHRPVIQQSTNQIRQKKKNIYDSMYRSGIVMNVSESAEVEFSEVTQALKLLSESTPDPLGAVVSLADSPLTDTSAAIRRKRHATVASKSASSPSPPASVGGSPVGSKVSDGHSPKSHPKKTKTRQAKSKHGAKSEKAHRLRSSNHAPRSGNSSRIKTRSKANPLKINLPLTFENASAHGWVPWQRSNSSSELSTIATGSSNQSTATSMASIITSKPQFRAQNTTSSSKSNLRMGTTIHIHDKGIYDSIQRKKRDLETTEKSPDNQTDDIKVVQDVKPGNDSRRYFQSRRFR